MKISEETVTNRILTISSTVIVIIWVCGLITVILGMF